MLSVTTGLLVSICLLFLLGRKEILDWVFRGPQSVWKQLSYMFVMILSVCYMLAASITGLLFNLYLAEWNAFGIVYILCLSASALVLLTMTAATAAPLPQNPLFVARQACKYVAAGFRRRHHKDRN
jgi:hypothetical protein